jgi:hypothetical protein
VELPTRLLNPNGWLNDDVTQQTNNRAHRRNNIVPTMASRQARVKKTQTTLPPRVAE